jgi:hypothetical protein
MAWLSHSFVRLQMNSGALRTQKVKNVSAPLSKAIPGQEKPLHGHAGTQLQERLYS